MLWGSNRAPSDTSPLVVLLHGFSSDERDLAGLIPALPREFRYLSLRAPHVSDTPHLGFAWFPLRFDAQGVAASGDADVQALADGATAAAGWVGDQLEELAERANVGTWDRLAFLGFSQGAITGMQLWRLQPGLFTTGVLLSGFVAPGELPGDGELADARPPLFWGRGGADSVIPVQAVDATSAWLPEHFTVDAWTDPLLDHAVSMPELQAVSAHLRATLG